MQWIITLDHLEDKCHGLGNYDGKEGIVREKSREQRHELVGAHVQAHAASLPYEFRLLDDDGEVYFSGRCGDIAAAFEDAAFAPLDWAEPNFGCTELQYRAVGATEWETL